MAFGTFFKKILTGAKNLVNKTAPTIRRGLDVVNKFAPVVSDVANKFGPIGQTIGGIANTVGEYAGRAGDYMDKTGLSNGFTGSRFDVPLLK